MLHRVRGVVAPLQLQLQGRQGVFPKVVVDAPVPLQALVADGGHILLLVGEVLHGVALEELYALLTGPLAVLLLLPEPVQLVDDFEEPLVLSVNGVNPDVVLLAPLKTRVHT